MSHKWHVSKEGQRNQQKRQRRGSLVFSEVPGLPSAGSKSNWFLTFQGHIYGLLWADSIIRLCEEGRSYSGLFNSKRSEQYFVWRSLKSIGCDDCKALMPQISESNLPEFHIIKTFIEGGCTVSMQKTQRGRNWTRYILLVTSVPWTGVRPLPWIVSTLAGGNHYDVSLWKL
jgi:hypothetical protein